MLNLLNMNINILKKGAHILAVEKSFFKGKDASK